MRSRFEQSRKEAANACSDRVEEALRDLYGCSRHLSVENVREGEYDTNGSYIPTDWLDYAGIDWLVDERPRFVPVGERLRPDDSRFDPDLSIRVKNGVGPPCERDRIADAIERGGLYPEQLLFGWYSETNLERLFCLDTVSVWSLLDSSDAGETHPSPGGSAARYLPVEALRQAGCIVSEWSWGDA